MLRSRPPSATATNRGRWLAAGRSGLSEYRARQIRNLSRAFRDDRQRIRRAVVSAEASGPAGIEGGRKTNENRRRRSAKERVGRCVDDGPPVNATIPRTACAVFDGGWCRSLSRHGVGGGSGDGLHHGHRRRRRVSLRNVRPRDGEPTIVRGVRVTRVSPRSL